jgi:hypothetical protein
LTQGQVYEEKALNVVDLGKENMRLDPKGYSLPGRRSI